MATIETQATHRHDPSTSSVVLQGASFDAEARDSGIVDTGGGKITVTFGRAVFIYGNHSLAEVLVRDGLRCLDRDAMTALVKSVVDEYELEVSA